MQQFSPLTESIFESHQGRRMQRRSVLSLLDRFLADPSVTYGIVDALGPKPRAEKVF